MEIRTCLILNPFQLPKFIKRWKALTTKTPDNLDPYLLKLDSDVIAEAQVVCPAQYLKFRKLPFFSLYIKEETRQSWTTIVQFPSSQSEEGSLNPR